MLCCKPREREPFCRLCIESLLIACNSTITYFIARAESLPEIKNMAVGSFAITCGKMRSDQKPYSVVAWRAEHKVLLFVDREETANLLAMFVCA